MSLQNIYEMRAAIFFCLSLFLLLIRFNTPTIRGMGWLSLAYAAGSGGSILVGLCDRYPNFWTIPVATLLILLSNIFVAQSFITLLRLPRIRTWPLYLPLMAGVGLTLYYFYVQDAIAIRMATMYLCNASQYAFLIGVLLHKGTLRTRMPRYTGALLYLLWIAISCRNAQLVLQTPYSNPLALNGVFGGLLPSVPVLIAVTMAFCFLWLAMTTLQNDLEMQSHTDALTGLLNRRGLETAGAREFSVALRRGSELSIIMLDIDHFKRINDHYGHERGDDTLVMVAECLRLHLRGMDQVARLGGEEFVVLLPDASEKRAVEVAERLRNKVLGMHIPYERGFFQITASLGVGCLKHQDRSWNDVLRRCDLAMYQAKRKGRNRVEAHIQEIPDHAKVKET